MQTESEWVIDMFRPEDSEEVVSLYREIYGEHFPFKAVYQADWHIEQARNGDSYRIVARMPGGRLAGTGALFRSVPTNPELYEGGGLLVREEYRTQNLSLPMIEFMNGTLPEKYHLKQTWGEAVCNHLVSQQIAIKSGSIACALEVDMMPEEAYSNLSERGQNTNSRVSSLVVFQAYCPDQQVVYLPLAYQDVLKELYIPFDFERTFLRKGNGKGVELNTQAIINTMPDAGMSRIIVTHIGVDFAAWLESTDKELIENAITVVQVIVPLNTPVVDLAVESLHKAGYWLGGLLPRWYGHDGLMMQKTQHIPDFSKIKVYSKPGKAVFQMVKEDYEQRGER